MTIKPLLRVKADHKAPFEKLIGTRKLWIAAALVMGITGCSDDDNEYRVPDSNAVPVTSDQSFTTEADIAIESRLTATDGDNDTLTFALVEDGSIGSAQIDANGDFTYTPNAQVVGSDSFTFSVADSTNPPVTATVSITIEAQQVAFSAYTRAAFIQAPTDEPLPVNGRAFSQDANDATFNDLLVEQ